MPDIYKHGYDNFKKITVLFILQIILGVLPVVLLVIYIGFSLYSNVVLGYTFIVIMAIAAALNFSITKRYNVLLSGFKGEEARKRVYRICKRTCALQEKQKRDRFACNVRQVHYYNRSKKPFRLYLR